MTHTLALARCLGLFALVGAIVSCRGASEPTHYFFAEHFDRGEFTLEGGASTPRPARSDVFTLRSETRRALATPLPSAVSFELLVPQNSMLRFAIAASPMGHPTLLVPVDFAVLIDSGDAQEQIFTGTIRRSQPDQWFPQQVDLSRWRGRNVRLTFEARRVAEKRPRAEQFVLPLWGNPVLVDRSTRPAKPSVILVSVDCLRADHLSAYGYPRETSPHIDAFSREAVLFETAVAASTYTLPSHASMLTGLPPSLHGANLSRGISPSVAYAPESLRRAGYRVSAVVSAAFLSQVYGFHRGFHSYRVNGGRAASIIDRALAVVDEGEGQAQFLFVHLYDVHAPYTAPKEFIDRFLEPGVDVTESIRVMTLRARPPNDAELKHVIALYDAEVAYVDQEIGRFFDELKARGLFDTSLIIITADHGEAFQEHGAWRHGRGRSLDKPGLYDEIVHIPLIVKWPGETTGVEVASVVSQMDVSATILEAAGIEFSSPWSLGLRRHRDGGRNVSTRHVIAEAVTRDPKRGASLQIALRDERSKYIASFRASTLSELYETSPIKEELYDLRSDPLEQHNLQADPGYSPGSFRIEVQSYLELVRESSPVDGEDITFDEELLEELRALGYLDP